MMIRHVEREWMWKEANIAYFGLFLEGAKKNVKSLFVCSVFVL